MKKSAQALFYEFLSSLAFPLLLDFMKSKGMIFFHDTLYAAPLCSAFGIHLFHKYFYKEKEFEILCAVLSFFFGLGASVVDYSVLTAFSSAAGYNLGIYWLPPQNKCSTSLTVGRKK